MVSLVRVMLFLTLGLFAYTLTPILANAFGSMGTKRKVGKFYGEKFVKVMHRMALVRKEMGYEVQQIKVDHDKGLLKTTLSSALMGDDKEFRFTDPASRIKRLWKKPLSINFKGLPTTVDAETSEWGYWMERHEAERGTRENNEDGTQEAKPYAKASSTMRVADPADAQAFVGKGASSRTIQSVENLTRERFRKYSGGVGMKEAARFIFAVIVGAGVVYGGFYVRNQLLGGGGGINTPIGGETLSIAMDMVVTLV